MITYEHARSCPDKLRLSLIETLEDLDVKELCRSVASVAQLFVKAADGIATTVCERDDANEPSNGELSPVLPAELARIDVRASVRAIQTH